MWGLLGGAYRTTNRPEEALRTYERALTHFPNDPLIRTDVVGIQLTLGVISPEEAARRLLQILDEGTVVYEMYVYLGRAYGLAGKPAESERAYRRAIELNPSSKPAQNGLALALIAQGKREVDTVGLLGEAGFAIGGELDRLIEGAAELNADRIDAAERIFREVLATHPESAGALLYLGLASAQRGNHADTVDFCRQAIALRPDLVDAHQQLGVSALALGRLDDAVAALETAAKLSPRRKEVYNRLGVAYVRSGRAEEARRAWLTALEIDPAFERARFNLERLESRP
jgi:tetratricopeptide (TPR) repeat protein